MRPQLDELAALTQTIDSGSVTAAAARLRIAKSVVSKRLKQLETSLGTSLFRRSGRRLLPTEAGLLAYERARAVLPQIDALIEDIASRTGGLRGPIQLSAPQSFGVRFISPAIIRFAQQHPAVEIRLDLDDRHVDLAGQGYDLAIRIGRLADSELKARRIGESPRGIYASPGWLQQHRAPRTPDELLQQGCLAYGNVRSGHSWQLQHRRHRSSRALSMPSHFVSNSGEVLLDAAVGGLGLTALPCFLAEASVASGHLKEIQLDDWQIASDPIQMVYAPGLALPARNRALMDFLAAELQPGSGPLAAPLS
ncbi:LysR family transcriptional regulator [Frateuria aurantia]